LAEDEEAIRKILEESDLSDFTDSDEDCWEPKLNVAAQRGLAVSSSDSSDEEGPSDTGTPRLKTSSSRQFSADTQGNGHQIDAASPRPATPSRAGSPSSRPSTPTNFPTERSSSPLLALKAIWEKKDFSPPTFQGPSTQAANSSIQNQIKDPVEYFYAYFSQGLFEDAANFTNQYCFSMTGKNLGTDSSEILRFLGLHILMGCIPFPRIRMFWQSGLAIHCISTAMTRDRFLALRTNFHVTDVQTRPENADENRLWKVQPFLDSVRARCLEIPREFDHYSIDEQMIPFTGRCDLKQYVASKPRPVGLKNFILATSGGIVLDFEVYQGKTTSLRFPELGLGPGVVLRLSVTLPENSCLYFDRYFTTVPLLRQLWREKIYATGTIMSNRLKHVGFPDDKQMKRGDMEQRVSNDGKIAAIKWRDSKCVSLISTVAGLDPVKNVQRWCKKDKKYIEVPCPAVVQNYNANMGGVDVVDQMIEYYRMYHKTRKWTLKVLIHFLELAVVNAWREYQAECKAANVPKKKILDLLNFRLSVGQTLAATSPRPETEMDVLDDDGVGANVIVEAEVDEEPVAKKPAKVSPLPLDSVRYDLFSHFPEHQKIASPRICRLPGCKSRSKITCEKCKVFLCLSDKKNCFKKFHERQTR